MELDALSALGIFRMSPARSATDARFPFGLGAEGLHEIIAASFGDMPAATGFALTMSQIKSGVAVWVNQTITEMNYGRVSPLGLTQLRPSAPPMLIARTRRLESALWAIEEAVQSRAVSLVIGEIPDLNFTASRRLALASKRCGVPILLLMPHTRQGSTAAVARWRISTQPSCHNRYDPNAPGPIRWQAVLERARQLPHITPVNFTLELNDETLSLSVVPGLASDTAEASTHTWPQYGTAP
ncbi:MAG: ImuA family protein [Henriciella sp.]|nr:hypothetical protein [Hyphomonadaceae bacterium]OUX95708.1 MAG: hypothetical protein CBB77_00845 [Hyphomonas sp. TMED17]